MSALREATAVDRLLSTVPPSEPVAVVRDGPSTIVGLRASAVVSFSGADAFTWLDGLREGWWAGWCAYDLGRAVERVPELNAPDPTIADVVFARFDTRVTFTLGSAPQIDGAPVDLGSIPSGTPASPRPLTRWGSSLGRGEWCDAIARILEHLRAGDCYQVNLTRRLSTDVVADAASLFIALCEGNPAPHAAFVRIGDVAVVSASPERFLRRDGRHVETRPIKGTSSDAAALSSSEKDRAENVMIVDLARNDLGRVCEYGSIDVPSLFAVEEHPGLFHLVSTVTGRLRPDVGTGRLLRATFPPASVTGCPKPRVLEIIETLEPVRRGVYCGAVGFIDADRDVLDLNVAIRTFTVTTEGTSFGVGGGIVADSDAEAEWDETELKARRLLAIAAGK